MKETWYQILRCTNNPEQDCIKIEDCGQYSPELKGYFITLSYNDLNTAKLLLMEEFPKYKDTFLEHFKNIKIHEPIIQDIQVMCSNLTEEFVKYYGSITNLYTGIRKDGIEEIAVEEDPEGPSWEDNLINEMISETPEPEEEIEIIGGVEDSKSDPRVEQLEKENKNLTEILNEKESTIESLNKRIEEITEEDNNKIVKSLEEENELLKSQITDLEEICKNLKSKNEVLSKAFPDSDNDIITEELCLQFIEIIKGKESDLAKSAILQTFNRYASQQDELSIKKLIKDIMISYKDLGGL